MPSHKTPNPGPEHSKEREFTTLLEEVRGQFRNFGEGLTDLQEKIMNILERLEKVEGKLDGVVLEVKAIKSIMATKKDLEPLATKKDLEKFIEESNKRLTALEAR